MTLHKIHEETSDERQLHKKHVESTTAPRPWKILIVDDDPDVHDVTVMALKRLVFDERKLTFLSAYSAAEARTLLVAHPDIVVTLLDVVMEDDAAGLTLVRHIRENMGNESIRILLRTGHPGLAPEESVTMDYDINDYREKTDLTARSLRTMLMSALRSYRALETIQNLNRELDNTQKELIYTLGEIAEFRTANEAFHIQRVGEISAMLGRKTGLAEEEANLLNLAASMHDFGKIAIREDIINKPGKLTDDEFEIIKTHSMLGHEIFKRSRRPLLRMAAIIAKEHHENYDGSGYPDGLKGDAIHLYSRIVALVDVYDALCHKRVYKEAWDEADAIDELKRQSGIKFDPALLAQFLENMDEVRCIVRKYDAD